MIRRVAVALALLLIPVPAFAWGFKGHTLISQLGAASFPSSMPAFVRKSAAIGEIGYLGPEEDRIKGAGTSWDDDFDPGHFADIDDRGMLGGAVKMSALPLDMKAYSLALERVHSTPYKAGYLPYNIMDGWERVRKDFAIWRVDDYMATHAATQSAREKFADARTMREALAIRDLGDWSHFVGDGSQPLHNTIHYNEGGWHSKFESTFVDEHVTEADIRALMKPEHVMPPAQLISQAQLAPMIASYLMQSAAEVKPLYAFARNGGFTSATPQAVRFTALQLARGAMELRDLSDLAWMDSINASVDYPEIAVRDVLSGKVVPRTPI